MSLPTLLGWELGGNANQFANNETREEWTHGVLPTWLSLEMGALLLTVRLMRLALLLLRQATQLMTDKVHSTALHVIL